MNSIRHQIKETIYQWFSDGDETEPRYTAEIVEVRLDHHSNVSEEFTAYLSEGGDLVITDKYGENFQYIRKEFFPLLDMLMNKAESKKEGETK